MNPAITIAKRAATEAGKIIEQGFENRDRIQAEKKGDNDFVSHIDRGAEETIIDIITQSYPDHDILGEEGGHSVDNGSEYQWVIDPLDGTTNFLRGIPRFAVSIALKKAGKLEAAVIYQPITDEFFVASRGDGASVNSRRLRVADTPVENGIITMGFVARYPELVPLQLAMIRDVAGVFPDVRRSGAASLDLCDVAMGRTDGYYELKLGQWDIAAGALIAQEAGAIVSDTDGNLTHLETGNVCAAAPKIYKPLIKVLRKNMADFS